MSLLLDALNKADQERKRNEAAPGINSNHEQRDDQDPRNNSILLIVAIIIGLLILLAAIYWLGQRSTATQANTASAPVSATSSTAKIAPSPATKKSVVSSETTSLDANTTANETGTADETVANLYQNTHVPDSNAAVTISPPGEAPAQPANDPAPVSAPDIASPISITQFANLPEIHDLPNNILEKIPSLGYSEHNYNANGASVKINGEIKHVNDQLPSGIVIDKILEDGMILHIDNYSFKMRAMNSWVNM
jgi:general secretion pathway protein B